MQLRLKNLCIGFPSLDVMTAMGDGEPAYQAKFPIPRNDDAVKLLDNAIAAVAKDKWGEKAKIVLDGLIEDKKVCFTKKEYRNKKTGEAYDGFKDQYYLSARNSKDRPTILDRFGKKVEDKGDIKRIIYSGCRVHVMVDIWAQDNSYGRRVNATLTGVMFATDDRRTGGGSGPADAGQFADLASNPDDVLNGADDLV